MNISDILNQIEFNKSLINSLTKSHKESIDSLLQNNKELEKQLSSLTKKDEIENKIEDEEYEEDEGDEEEEEEEQEQEQEEFRINMKPCEQYTTYMLHNNYKYDEKISCYENFNIFSKLNNTVYIIENAKKTKTFYKTAVDYSKTVLLKIDKTSLKSYMNASINKITFMTNQPVCKGNMSIVNDLFGISSCSVDNAILKIIKLLFEKRSMSNLTKIEATINFTDCVRGPVHYIQNQNLTIKEGYSYDINSHHAYILQSSEFLFPIIENEKPKKINTIDKNAFGIYVLNINYKEFKSKLPWFALPDKAKHDKKKLYSHYMIQLFDMVGLKYELCFDNCYNYIPYRKSSMVKSSSIFKNAIKALYENKSNPESKEILTKLLGKLTQSSYETKIIDIKDNTIEENKYTKVVPVDSFTSKVTSYKGGFLDTQRIKLFFYDFIRLDMYKRYIKDKPLIYRIKSDSIIYQDTIDSGVSSNIGCMKLEYYFENVLMKNVNSKIHPYTEKYSRLMKYDKETNTFIQSELSFNEANNNSTEVEFENDLED